MLKRQELDTIESEHESHYPTHPRLYSIFVSYRRSRCRRRRHDPFTRYRASLVHRTYQKEPTVLHFGTVAVGNPVIVQHKLQIHRISGL